MQGYSRPGVGVSLIHCNPDTMEPATVIPCVWAAERRASLLPCYPTNWFQGSLAIRIRFFVLQCFASFEASGALAA
jgi:hypothetical protein